MKNYLKSFVYTLFIVLLAFIIATISDINDLFKLSVIALLILIPSIIISAIFWGIYYKKYLIGGAVFMFGILYFYLLAYMNSDIDPFGLMIYTATIYLPLIIVGSISSSFLRSYHNKKIGTNLS